MEILRAVCVCFLVFIGIYLIVCVLFIVLASLYAVFNKPIMNYVNRWLDWFEEKTS